MTRRLYIGSQQTLRNLASIRRVGSGEASAETSKHEGRQEFFHEQGLIFGSAYESATVLPDGTVPPEVANPVSDYVPTAHPGCRAPHVWLERAGQWLSTLDLFSTGLVLLAAQAGAAWCQAATEIACDGAFPSAPSRSGWRGTWSIRFAAVLLDDRPLLLAQRAHHGRIQIQVSLNQFRWG